MAATSRPTYEELQALFQKSEASRQKLRNNLVTPPPPTVASPRIPRRCLIASPRPRRLTTTLGRRRY